MCNFRLYHNPLAKGTLVLATQQEFAGISILSGNHQFLCTTVTQEKASVEGVYNAAAALMDPDMLLFSMDHMENLLLTREYFHNLFSSGNCWLVGHITEHFLPSSLFRELSGRIFRKRPDVALEAERGHLLASNLISKNKVNIILYNQALSNFMLSGELDFFNHKVILSTEHRLEVLRHVNQLVQEAAPTSVKLIRVGFNEDFKYITNPCLFLSSSTSYLRLENRMYRNNLLLIKNEQLRQIFDTFFHRIWQDSPDNMVTNRTEIPIMLLHISGHMGCVNTPMLALAGITADTDNPQGGIYGRMEGSNEPNGYLEESAMLSCQLAMSKRMKVSIPKMLSGLQESYVKNSVTTAQEGAAEKSSLSILKLASALGVLKIDVVAYPLISKGSADLIAAESNRVSTYKKHIKIGGYKMILDGSLQGRSAWMSQPYLGGDPDYCGYPWITDEEALNYCLQSIQENRQILAHCNGDAASEQFLSAYELALKQSTSPNKDSLRPVMIHCQTVRNDQLDRMVQINMIPSIFVGHVYYWGDIHVKNFGQERGHHISPVKDALDRDLVINFHQDAPITKPNMLHSVWTAVNRRSRLGNIIGEDQKIDIYNALKAVTINAAYAYFEEDSKGSIKVGKRADLVILDQCPLDVEPNQIKDITVLETIKDGKVIYKNS